jgi:hypothetical protein
MSKIATLAGVSLIAMGLYAYHFNPGFVAGAVVAVGILIVLVWTT